MPQLEDLTSKTEEIDTIGLISVINLNISYVKGSTLLLPRDLFMIN